MNKVYFFFFFLPLFQMWQRYLKKEICFEATIEETEEVKMKDDRDHDDDDDDEEETKRKTL